MAYQPFNSSCVFDLEPAHELGPRRVGPLVIKLVTLGIALLASTAFGQAIESGPTPAGLKKLSLEELMDLDVTSVSKRAEKLSQAASAIQVITQEDIRRSGATSLPEALRLASNLQVAQVDSRQWAISARGFNGTSADKLLVLIDGRAVYTPLYAGVFWEVQDTLLEDIDRIEVISGPGASLWGSNAVNGVINITTKTSNDTQGTLLLGGGGTERRGFGGARYGGELSSNIRFRVYGKSFDRDSTVLPDGRDAGNGWRMSQGGFRMDWSVSAVDWVTLQGDLYGGRIAQPATDDIGVNGGNVLGRWSHTVSDASDVKLQIYYDRTHRNVPGIFSENLDTYDLDFQHRFPVATRHNVVWGLGYRLTSDDVGNTPGFAFLPARVSHQLFSAFVQDEITVINERLHVTLGTKLEHNDYTGFELQPSARLSVYLSSRQTVWTAVSRAVRTPARLDTDLFVPAVAPYFIAGGPHIVSEELLAYELGYRVRPLERLSLSVATFYNDYNDIRSVEQVNPPLPFPVVLANGQRGQSYGVELAAEYQATDRWRLQGGLTGLHIQIRPKPGSTDTTMGSGESHDPNRQLFLRSSLDLPRHVQLDTSLRYVAAITNQSVPAYGEMDVRIACQPVAQLDLSIVGQNLLHDHHAEFGQLRTRQEIERGVYGKATWRF